MADIANTNDVINTISQQSILNKTSSDKFILVFNLPNLLKNIDADSTDNQHINSDSMQFSVEGTVVPEVTIPSIPINYAGQHLAISSLSKEKYTKNKVDFTVDNRFTNYWTLWNWLNLINDQKAGTYNKADLVDNGTKKNIQDYQTTISIFGMDEYENRIIEFKFYKAFITRLGGIQYNYKESNLIKSFFEFDYSQLWVSLLNDGTN